MPKNIRMILIMLVSSLMVCLLAASEVQSVVSNQNKVNDNDILAEYNGGKITRKDLNDRIDKLPPQVQGRYKTVDGQTQILEIVATEEIFYAKALQMNIQSLPSVLDKINNSKRQFYIQEYYKRNITDAIKITDEDKNKFYQDNIKSYFVSPYISIYYIQAHDEAEALKALKEINSGVDFDAVSDKYNTNTYAKGLKGRIKNIRLNGHIPGVGNDSELDSLIDAASADQTKFHGPYFTPTGWHIFKVFERVEGRQRLYMEVEGEIEQRLRPQMENQTLQSIVAQLKTKYSVVIDTTTIKMLDLRDRKKNSAYEGIKVVTSSDPTMNLTVKELLDRYEKLSPQEQLFYVKEGGALRVAEQELTRSLMFIDAVALRYEDYFKDDPEYVQMQRYQILQEAFKQLVLDRINVTTEDARAYYESRIDAYTTPESRAIEVLWFESEKAAKKAHKQYQTAVRKNRQKDIDKIISTKSLKPTRSLLENQYDNGIITGVGPDEAFSKRVWNQKLNEVSPVFTTSKGEIVFFRVVKETPKVVRPFTEVEPRIYGMIRKEAEKTMQEQVKEELFLEFEMNKYPERIRLLLSAEELFNLADNAARQRKFTDALVYYDQIINNYVNNVDDYKAYFMKAFLVAEEMNEKQTGLDLFRNFLRRYPKGELNESAQFMIDELEGKHDATFDDSMDAE